MAGAGSGDLALRKSQGSRRARQETRRPLRVHFSLTETEFAELEEAASRAGLARGAFAAQIVLAHVRERRRRAGGTGQGATARAGARRRARAPDRRQPQPGGEEAERDRAALG